MTVTDGTIVFSNLRDRVDNRIEGINANAVIGADRNINVTGSARASAHPLKFEIKAAMPAPPLERQNIPVDLTLDAPGLLQSPLSAKAEVRLNGSVVMINGLSGTLGDGAFNGWASVDIASKPLVKLDLDFQRLDIADCAGAHRRAPAASQPWSNAPIDLSGLNYVDAQARISAADLNHRRGAISRRPRSTRRWPAACSKAGVSNLGAYGGQANGDLIVDASAAQPALTRCAATLPASARCRCCRARPISTSSTASCRRRSSVRSSGASQRAIMSNLDGTVFAVFQDGAIRGVNVAQMIRSLTSGTLSGWQESKEQATDLTPAFRLVPDREGPGHHQRSQSGRPAGAGDRRRHHRPRRASRWRSGSSPSS